MTSINKPPVEQILRRKIAAQSGAHFKWSEAKKKVAKTVDLKVFKRDFGPALDGLSQIYAGAKEVQRFYPKLDDRTLKPVKERLKKVEGIRSDYVTICQREAAKAGTTPAQKKAWSDLETALTLAQADITTVKSWLKKAV